MISFGALWIVVSTNVGRGRKPIGSRPLRDLPDRLRVGALQPEQALRAPVRWLAPPVFPQGGLRSPELSPQPLLPELAQREKQAQQRELPAPQRGPLREFHPLRGVAGSVGISPSPGVSPGAASGVVAPPPVAAASKAASSSGG